jgi:phosphoglycolate phosphatase-like HAD superfamily hydrolase
MPSRARLVWLFDVDGTLLTTAGAAREAFAAAVRDRLGVDDDLDGIAFAGRTEPLILADILARHGRRLDRADEARFWDAVFGHMRAGFQPPRGRLMPGVPDLLDALARDGGNALALLTGNMTEMARIKLARFGLLESFAFGAFGEEAPDRNALACLAASRAAIRYGVPPQRCIVVGDTEHDIGCARAAGARAVAVCTGACDRPTLAAHAPDLLLDDLAGTEALLEWARGVAGRA